jgi:hypothetical protein
MGGDSGVELSKSSVGQAGYTASEEKRFSILIDCWGRQIPTSRLANSIFQMQTLQIEGDVRRHSCGFSKGFVVRIAMFGPPIERGAIKRI